MCLLLCFLSLSIGSLFLPLRKTLTYDEHPYYESGEVALSMFSEEQGERGLRERNIMPANILHPLFSQKIGQSIPNSIIPRSFKESLAGKVFLGKTATIFVSLILAIYVFFWSRSIYGEKAGFLALSLYVFDPNIIAHSRVVHQDLFGTFAVFVATYYFWKFLKFGGRINALLSVISFGIAQITRYTALYLLPIFGILTILFYAPKLLAIAKANQVKALWFGLRKFLIAAFIFLLTALVIINIGFAGEKTFTRLGNFQFESKTLQSFQASSSLVRSLPVPLPAPYIEGLDLVRYKQETGYGNGLPYLLGQLGWENGQAKGFLNYYLVVFFYKVPIATQIILLIAIFSLIRRRSYANFLQNEAFLVVPVLFFLTSFSLANAQLGIRYILMIFPFLFVFASQILLNWERFKRWHRVLVPSLVAYLIVSNLSYFPHYISYFNEFLLDRKMGYQILADSNLDWGQNIKYMERYLAQNPDVMFALSPQNFATTEQISINNVFLPEQPRPGLVAVEANALLGITASPARYQWIRENLKPVDHVAYNYLIFELKRSHLSPQN